MEDADESSQDIHEGESVCAKGGYKWEFSGSKGKRSGRRAEVMRYDKIFVLCAVMSATCFSASVTEDMFTFLSNYASGAAAIAALFYITEE